MKCEDVRRALPELAESGARPSRRIRSHLAGCPDCAEELRRYGSILLALAAMRDEVIEPAEGFLSRILAQIPDPARQGLIRRVAADERVYRAAFSVGGAAVGATAIAILWSSAVFCDVTASTETPAGLS